MADDPKALTKTFEPILLFHPDEQFFPIDPKWYLERCALWRAAPKYDDKTNWGEPPRGSFPRVPQIAAGSLAALKGEATAGKTWLGDPALDLGVAKALPPGQEAPPGDERFLSFIGWEPPQDPAQSVTATSTNRHAALTPQDYAAPLAGSRPWYHVEFLDNKDLIKFCQPRSPNGLDLTNLVAKNPRLNAPVALIYHLFYAVHEEPLEGCAGAGEAETFGSHAGEWGAVAVLMDADHKPLFVGLSSRNVGDPDIVGPDERRVGMSVSDWSAVQTVGDADGGQHPKIFVSKGTHGHYLAPGPHPVVAFTPGVDTSGMSCGAVETLDDAISGEVVTSTPGSPYPETWVVIAKGITIILIVWLAIEVSNGSFGEESTALPTPPTDEAGGPAFGTILRPDGLAVPEAAQATTVTDWDVKDFKAPAPDGRSYSVLVDRSKQPWWAPRVESAGFAGRWGPRVTNDPNSRRAGTKCPDFLALFLEGVAVQLNK